MKKIGSTLLLYFIMTTANAQVLYYGHGCLTQLSLNVGFSLGAVVEKEKHQIALSRIGYIESSYDFFNNNFKLNTVKFSNTYAIQYGYGFNIFKKASMSLVPSLGIGLTRGKWRTNELDSSGRGSGLFSLGTREYKEILFTHLSVVPQLEIQMRNSYLGVAIGTNCSLIPSAPQYSRPTFYFKLIFGVLK